LKKVVECLVSIIVPVYNVKTYLDACIESIVRQSYVEIEIVLVDDGSTDGSGELCDAWGRRDSRIKVIHKRNGGLSEARNKGLDIAQGTWILFVDSDDYIQVDLVKKCYEAIQIYKADLVFFDYEKVEESCDREIPSKENNLIERYSGKEMLKEFIKNEKGSVISCNKMYHRKIWDTLRFPVGRIHEDEYVIVDIWKQVDKAIYRKEVLYYYRQREGSILHSKTLKSRYDAVDAFWLRCEKLKEDPELYYQALGKYFNAAIDLCSFERKKQKRKKIIEQIKMNWDPQVKNYLKKRKKIRLNIFYLCPTICLFIMKWKQSGRI
jgi:glycosyltransferase involved in cell wall biosynthesis